MKVFLFWRFQGLEICHSDKYWFQMGVNIEHRWKDTEGGKRKRKMKSDNNFPSNVTRFPGGHCFIEGSQASPVCLSGKSNMKMSIEYWWNGSDRGKTEVLGKKPALMPLSSQ